MLALYLPFASRRPAGEPWAGTLYEEPGNLWFGADPANWPEIYPSFTTQYLQDIASAFEEYPDAFQSYDLLNEPDGIRDFNTSGSVRSHIQNCISYTHRTVDAVHQASGKMVLRRYTIGWAGIGTDPVKRQMTSSLIQSGVVHAYLSAHSYTEGAVFESVINVNSGFAASLRIPYVCSEFWWLDSPAPARAIEPMLNVLLRHRSGGQMWGFLQTNAFYVNRMPVDGVVRPLPGQWLPTQPWLVRKLAFDVPLPKHLRDVEQWARTAPRRTPVYPP